MMDTQDPLALLDFKPSCDARGSDRVDHPAEYSVKCRHCGDIHLLCRDALAKARQAAMTFKPGQDRQTQCCGHVQTLKGTGRAPQLEDLFLVERLDK